MQSFKNWYRSLNEAFEFENKSKETAYTKNYNQAKVFLKDKELKDKIDRLKEGDPDASTNETTKNILTSIAVARKVANNKRMKEETRKEAEELLQNAGIDLKSVRENDKKILEKAKEVFNKRYQEAQGEEEKEDKEEITTSKTSEPKKEKAPEKEKESEEETPEEDDEPKKVEVPTTTKGEKTSSKEKKEVRKLRDPQKIYGALEDYENKVINQVDEFIKKAPENKKKSLQKIKNDYFTRYRKEKNKIQKQRDRWENVPNFQSKLKATTNSQIAYNNAKAVLDRMFNKMEIKEAPGALERTGKAVKETGQAIGRGVKKLAQTRAAQKAGQAIGRGAKKVGQVVGREAKKLGAAAKRGAEKASPASERGVEKAAEKIGSAIKTAKEVGKKVKEKLKSSERKTPTETTKKKLNIQDFLKKKEKTPEQKKKEEEEKKKKEEEKKNQANRGNTKTIA